jgi:hypothetical protein
MGERAAYTLARGTELSRTFRAPVDRLQGSDVVVYVVIAPLPGRSTVGGIQFLGASTAFRVLRVVLSSQLTTPQMVALLGHELQHALEVAQNPEIRDRASFLFYYEQFGVAGSDHLARDSQAAREIGERIRQELTLAHARTRRE